MEAFHDNDRQADTGNAPAQPSPQHGEGGGGGGTMDADAEHPQVHETSFMRGAVWDSVEEDPARTLPVTPEPTRGGGGITVTAPRGAAAEPVTSTLKLAGVTVAIGGLLFGYDIGVISGALLQLREEFDLDDAEAEAVVSSLLVGAVVASMSGGYICDLLGRRNTIAANAGLFIVAALALAVSSTLAMLIAARVLVG